MSLIIETGRRTGRTTRMIKDAVNHAVAGNPSAVVVRLSSDVEMFRNLILEMYGRPPPNLKVVPWLAIAPVPALNEKRFGIELPDSHSLHGKLFYDHSVFETHFKSVLKWYHAYDEDKEMLPVAEVIESDFMPDMYLDKAL